MSSQGSGSGVQVIGAGFGRTGTMSTRAALLELGFSPCYHMKVAYAHFWHMWFWVRAGKGLPVNYRKFFRKYRAVVDWPASEFYRKIHEAFPEARIILNVRDPEQWYASLFDTIWAVQPHFPWWFPRAVRKLHDIIIWEGRFQGKFTDKGYAIRRYLEHIEDVKHSVPPDKLLVFDVHDGWEPLCNFLGVPIPNDKPFPKLNDRRYFRRLIMWLRILEWLVPVVVLAGIVMILFWLD